MSIGFNTTEFVALLRVLSIIHIAISMPRTRFLAGNTKDLAAYNFGDYDMGTMLDLMEECFVAITDNGMLMLDESYMMDNMFSNITSKVDPFQEYLGFIFRKKLSKQIDSSNNVDYKVLPYDVLRAELFYPTRSDIRQTESLVHQLAEVAATAFLVEFRV